MYNYLDVNKGIMKILQDTVGKLIVIDNADILLNDTMKKYIAFDDKNQYLIIGRNLKNLMASQDYLFELVSSTEGE